MTKIVYFAAILWYLKKNISFKATSISNNVIWSWSFTHATSTHALSTKVLVTAHRKIIIFFSQLTFEVQTLYSLNQVWLYSKLKVKLNVSHSHSVCFVTPSSVNLPLSCIHKAFLNTLAAFCVSAGWRLTQALLDREREREGGATEREMRSRQYIFSQRRQWLRAQRWVSAAEL